MTIIYSQNIRCWDYNCNFLVWSASKVQDYFSNKEMIFIQDGVSFIFEPIIESKVIPETAILRNVEVSCYDLNGASIEDIISSDNSYGARRITLI